MTYRLFLDDIHPVEKFYKDGTWVIVRNVKEAVRVVEKNGAPDFVSFDHDLGEMSDTGKDFANYLVNADMDGRIDLLDSFDFKVHSANPIGAKNIASLMTSYLHNKRVAKDPCWGCMADKEWGPKRNLCCQCPKWK